MENCNDLELAVIKNNFNKVERLITGGLTIYCNSQLCNGYYEKIGKEHPKECDKNLCYKNSIYHGLVNNYLAYKTIHKYLHYLQYIIPDLRLLCICCPYTITNTDPQFLLIRTIILDIMKNFRKLSCECAFKYNTANEYSENFLYFNTVYNFLAPVLDNLAINIISYYTVDINNLGLIELEQFNTCIHADVLNNLLSNCSNVDPVIIPNLTLSTVLNKLILAIQYYLLNNNILKLLFNQQAYELYQYLLLTTKNENIIIDKINCLYNNVLLTDINYINLYTKKTILDMTICHDDFINVIKHLFLLNSTVHSNILIIALKKGYFYSGLEICIHSPEQYKYELINNESIFKYIMLNCSDDVLKLKYIIDFLSSGVNLINDNPIMMALECDNAHDIIQVLINDGNILSSISYLHTSYAIMKNKSEALQILFTNGANPNGDNMDHIPIFIYLDYVHDTQDLCNNDIDNITDTITETTHTLTKTTNVDMINTTLLNIIINANANVNIKNKQGYTPLHIAAKYNIVSALILLLENGADPFITHSQMNSTALHIAIENNNINVINKLVLCEKNDGTQLINTINNNKYSPLMLAVVSQSPVQIIKQLQINDKLDYNYNDDMGRNILYFIIEHNNLTSNIKYILFDLLLVYINIEHINLYYDTPIIIKALLLNLYDIVRLIIKKLYEQEKIIITGDVSEFFMKQSYNINIVTINTANYYNLIIKYLQITDKEISSTTDTITVCSQTVNNTINIFTIIASLILINSLTLIIYERI